MDKLEILDELLEAIRSGAVALSAPEEAKLLLLEARQACVLQEEPVAAYQRETEPIRAYFRGVVDIYAERGGYAWDYLNRALDEESHRKKYGEDWRYIPEVPMRYYHARGYIEAVKIEYYRRLQKIPEIAPQEAEQLTRELKEKAGAAIQDALDQFLKR